MMVAVAMRAPQRRYQWFSVPPPSPGRIRISASFAFMGLPYAVPNTRLKIVSTCLK